MKLDNNLIDEFEGLNLMCKKLVLHILDRLTEENLQKIKKTNFDAVFIIDLEKTGIQTKDLQKNGVIFLRKNVIHFTPIVTDINVFRDSYKNLKAEIMMPSLAMIFIIKLKKQLAKTMFFELNTMV